MLVYQPWPMQYKMSYAREPVPAAPRPAGRTSKAPARTAEGHFDPDELTRRLYAVLAEQQKYAERKRRARGEPPEPRDCAGADPGATTRQRNHARPGRDGRRQQPAETAADLITQLRRCHSAKPKPSHAAAGALPGSDAPHRPDEYHHVPREAAKQFARTTTQENMRRSPDLVHKLSRRALKFHMDRGRTGARPGTDGEKTALSPAELSRALRRTQSQRDRVLDRNQFQRTRILEEAAQLDQQQQHHQYHHTKSTHNAHAAGRRNSTGTLTAMHDPLDQRTEDHHGNNNNHHHPNGNSNRRSFMLMEPLVDVADEHAAAGEGEQQQQEQAAGCAPHARRVDWTQSDEPPTTAPPQPPLPSSSSRPTTTRPTRLLLSPLLRKADSLWMLRGRIGVKGSSPTAAPSLSPPSTSSSARASGCGKAEDNNDNINKESVSSPRSPRVGFFAKFKR